MAILCIYHFRVKQCFVFCELILDNKLELCKYNRPTKDESIFSKISEIFETNALDLYTTMSAASYGREALFSGDRFIANLCGIA